jgi:YHS domain-containing protein
MGMMDETPEPIAKKARRSKVQEEEEEVFPEAEAPLDSLEDLEPGAVVLYWHSDSCTGWRGVISDAFVELDEFWLCDEESGEIVRDDDGDIYHFKSTELQLVAKPPIAALNPNDDPAGGVIMLGTEQQMMQVLTHFGTPDPLERHDPQMLLAFPCEKLEAHCLLADANQGIDDGVRKLAQELRSDIHVAVRVYHLKQIVSELGPDLQRMEGFYLLSAITVPYSWDDIEVVKGWKKKWRRDVCNQIDVGPTARGLHLAKDATPEDIARRTLGVDLGLQLSEALWMPETQTNLRNKIDVQLPLSITDINGGILNVLLLPTDAIHTVDAGILTFNESADADYVPELESEPEVVAEPDELEEDKQAAPKPYGKTIDEWEKDQAQFSDLPKLPPDWVRVRSKKGEVYFFNKKTQEATFEQPKPAPQQAEPPLPAGWTKHVSKSTGKSYYFHAATGKSQFEKPTE